MSFFNIEQPLVLVPGEGTHLSVLGEMITLLVSGKESRNSIAVITETSPPGGGTPLHTHHREDEALYVLEGEYEIQCGDRTIIATAGTFVFAPRGIAHRLTNIGAGRSRILGIVTPSGFEGFWQEISLLTAPPCLAEVSAIAQRYGLEIHA